MGIKTLKLLLWFLASLAAPSFAGASEDASLLGNWHGEVIYREAGLPIRLEISKQGDGLHAALDIPSLIYANQPVAIQKKEGSTYVIDFPFGIGEIKITPGGSGGWVSEKGTISLVLTQTLSPPFRKVDITFGAFQPDIPGTVYIPEGEGPFPAAVLLAGSGNANRDQWSYASWADFYARQGVAALIYDRRSDMFALEDGSLMTIEDHARDAAAAVALLKAMPEIDSKKVGAAGASRGAWLAIALGDMVPDLAFMVLLSPAPVTPAEQEVDSNLTGIAQDGLPGADLAAARNYYRLYFYVAQTKEGWPLLEPLIAKARQTNWGQYVDQPQRLEDLGWWHANMNFDSESHLKGLKMPVLAIWGGADFISPYAKYWGILRHDLEIAGNTNVTTRVFPDADHRIEIDPGVDSQGNWHWFGLAPGCLKVISDWLREILE